MLVNRIFHSNFYMSSYMRILNQTMGDFKSFSTTGGITRHTSPITISNLKKKFPKNLKSLYYQSHLTLSPQFTLSYQPSLTLKYLTTYNIFYTIFNLKIYFKITLLYSPNFSLISIISLNISHYLKTLIYLTLKFLLKHLFYLFI